MTVENGCTESEALSATQKAKDLLNEYDLNMSEVEVRAEEFETLNIDLNSMKRNDAYFIIKNIANLTNTKTWINRSDVKGVSYTFFGTKKDTQIANYLYHLLLNSIKYESEKYKKTRQYINNPANGRTKVTSFKYGMAARLSQRLHDMHEATKIYNQEKGLVLYDKMSIVEQKFNEMLGIRLKKTNSRGNSSDYSSYLHGKKAGDKVVITTGIKANSSGQKFLK
jgi:hypothetical protein